MRFRFRSTFLFSLLLFVGLTAFLIGATSYYSARVTAEDLSEQVLDQTSARVDQQVTELVGAAVDVVALNKRLVEAGLYRAHDFAPLVAYWLEVMRVHLALTSVFVGVEATGESTGVSRLQHELSIWQSNLDARGRLELREFWPAGYPSTPYRYDPDKLAPDIRGRPWYVAARTARHPIWTDTYQFLGVSGVGATLGVTYAAPVFATDGSLAGVLTADFELGELAKFLATLHVAQSGFAFVVERRADGTEHLIAHPEGLADDPRVRAFFEASAAAADHGFSPVRFQGADGTAYFGGVRALSGADAPRWRIGIVVPESEVFARVEQSNRISVLIALAGLVLAVVCGLYVARQVARPLEKLSREMAEIAELRLDARPIAHSIVVEVDRVAVAAEEIKTGLRQKRVLEKYVPEGARRDIARGRGGDLALGGARVPRTILFSDLRGFTAMSERLDPAAVVALLNTYLEAMTAAILDHGGDINEYIGDAILAVFAEPGAAVDAALAMQDALAELRRASPDPEVRELRMGVGVHAGEVVEGNIGTQERVKFGVVGDTVNLAARIQDRSRDGTHSCIFVSDSVRAVTEARVEYVLIGDLAMKGKAEPVRVFEVVGPATPSGRPTRAT